MRFVSFFLFICEMGIKRGGLGDGVAVEMEGVWVGGIF